MMSFFRLHREGGYEGRTKIASYCVHDARLPLRLMRHLHNLPHMTEMSPCNGSKHKLAFHARSEHQGEKSNFSNGAAI